MNVFHKGTQTTLIVFPHYIEPNEVSKVRVCNNIAIQTVAHFSESTTPSQIFEGLSYTPIQDIYSEAKEIRDIPKRFVLTFGGRESLKSLTSVDLAKGSSITSEIKSSLKSSLKTKEEMAEKMIQTDLCVKPFFLGVDSVAQVYCNVEIQTSATFIPDEDNQNVATYCKQFYTHDGNVRTSTRQDRRKPKSSVKENRITAEDIEKICNTSSSESEVLDKVKAWYDEVRRALAEDDEYDADDLQKEIEATEEEIQCSMENLVGVIADQLDRMLDKFGTKEKQEANNEFIRKIHEAKMKADSLKQPPSTKIVDGLVTDRYLPFETEVLPCLCEKAEATKDQKEHPQSLLEPKTKPKVMCTCAQKISKRVSYKEDVKEEYLPQTLPKPKALCTCLHKTLKSAPHKVDENKALEQPYESAIPTKFKAICTCLKQTSKDVSKCHPLFSSYAPGQPDTGKNTTHNKHQVQTTQDQKKYPHNKQICELDCNYVEPYMEVLEQDKILPQSEQVKEVVEVIKSQKTVKCTCRVPTKDLVASVPQDQKYNAGTEKVAICNAWSKNDQENEEFLSAHDLLDENTIENIDCLGECQAPDNDEDRNVEGLHSNSKPVVKQVIYQRETIKYNKPNMDTHLIFDKSNYPVSDSSSGKSSSNKKCVCNKHPISTLDGPSSSCPICSRQTTLDSAVQKSSVLTRNERIAGIIVACEREMEPIKQGIVELKARIKELNLPDIASNGTPYTTNTTITSDLYTGMLSAYQTPGGGIMVYPYPYHLLPHASSNNNPSHKKREQNNKSCNCKISKKRRPPTFTTSGTVTTTDCEDRSFPREHETPGGQSNKQTSMKKRKHARKTRRVCRCNKKSRIPVPTSDVRMKEIKHVKSVTICYPYHHCVNKSSNSGKSNSMVTVRSQSTQFRIDLEVPIEINKSSGMSDHIADK